MSSPAIVHSSTSVDLKPAPIDPRWIVEGRPVARSAELSRSRDMTATTLVWDCTAGKFDWFYDLDETIHVLEGSAVVGDAHSTPKRLGPGDVVFFPAGSQARWHVENYVRKLAFFRRALPRPVELLTRGLWQARTLLRAPQQALASWSGGDPAAVKPGVIGSAVRSEGASGRG